MRASYALAAAIVALLVASPGVPAAAAETLHTVTEIGVYDATGKKVGLVSPMRAGAVDRANLHANVALRLGSGTRLAVYVTRSAIRPNEGVFFTTADCTGQAYVALGAADIGGARRTVYVVAGSYMEALRLRYAVNGAGQCVPVRTRYGGWPAQPTDVHLADYFTPPFSLRAVAGPELTPIATASAEAQTVADGEAPRLFRVGPTVARDTRGTGIGVVSDSCCDRAIAALVTGSGTVLVVAVGAFAGYHTDHYLKYELPDCAGATFLGRPGGYGLYEPHAPLAPRLAVVGERATVWIGDRRASVQTLRSFRYPDGHCVNQTVTHEVVAATPAGLDLADYLAPPFTFQVMRGGPIEPR